jgi:hypothetical protein
MTDVSESDISGAPPAESEDEDAPVEMWVARDEVSPLFIKY